MTTPVYWHYTSLVEKLGKHFHRLSRGIQSGKRTESLFSKEKLQLCRDELAKAGTDAFGSEWDIFLRYLVIPDAAHKTQPVDEFAFELRWAFAKRIESTKEEDFLQPILGRFAVNRDNSSVMREARQVARSCRIRSARLNSLREVLQRKRQLAKSQDVFTKVENIHQRLLDLQVFTELYGTEAEMFDSGQSGEEVGEELGIAMFTYPAVRSVLLRKRNSYTAEYRRKAAKHIRMLEELTEGVSESDLMVLASIFGQMFERKGLEKFLPLVRYHTDLKVKNSIHFMLRNNVKSLWDLRYAHSKNVFPRHHDPKELQSRIMNRVFCVLDRSFRESQIRGRYELILAVWNALQLPALFRPESRPDYLPNDERSKQFVRKRLLRNCPK